MTIKKVYEDLIKLLEENPNKKVSTILDDVYKLASSKHRSKNFIVDENGKVTHIFCYYHKKWEDVTKVEYGSKANSATGLNSMCKEGVNQWTKQQREYKQNMTNLLPLVSSGEISPDQITDKQKEYEEQRLQIVPRKDGQGVDELEEDDQQLDEVSE